MEHFAEEVASCLADGKAQAFDCIRYGKGGIRLSKELDVLDLENGIGFQRAPVFLHSKALLSEGLALVRGRNLEGNWRLRRQEDEEENEKKEAAKEKERRREGEKERRRGRGRRRSKAEVGREGQGAVGQK